MIFVFVARRTLPGNRQETTFAVHQWAALISTFFAESRIATLCAGNSPPNAYEFAAQARFVKAYFDSFRYMAQ
jgi:hypothetical protein